MTLVITGFLLFNTMQPQMATRIKGGSSLRVVVQNQNGDVEERPNHVYHPFERIQFVYSCTDNNKFMLFSIDEKGKLSTYLPSGSDSSITLQSGADIPLPHSIQLDDYIGKELFIALFSKQKLEKSVIQERITHKFNNASDINTLSLQDTKEYSVQSFLITKKEQIQ